MKRFADNFLAAACVFAAAFLVYSLVAWGVFVYRNPLANSMSYYRDFGAVVTWKKLDKHQPAARDWSGLDYLPSSVFDNNNVATGCGDLFGGLPSVTHSEWARLQEALQTKESENEQRTE